MLFARRINSIIQRKNDISIREEMLLKRLVKRVKKAKRKLNFEDLTYYFPGKSGSFLERCYYMIAPSK